jgi:cytochrome c553
MRHLIAIVFSTIAILVNPLAHAAGDAEKGKTVALEKGCAGCHGVDGNSPNAQWPKIAGQGYKYLVKQLKAFRDNNLETSGRNNEVMYGFASQLTDEQIEDLSAYFSQQKVSGGEADPAMVELGYHIYRGGDKTKGIPSCMGCHGPSGAGNPASGYPKLSGQWADYTEQQLIMFKTEDRKNDMNQMMRDITSKMNREEIKAVSSYIQGLRYE